MKNKIFCSLVGLLFIAACNQADLTSNDATTASPQLASDGFSVTTFSPFIHVNAAGTVLRLDFGFFPSESNFSFENQTITLPCNFSADKQDDMISVNVSAPLKPQGCNNEIILSFLRDQGEALTVDGIEVTLSNGEYKKFESAFGLTLTKEGVLKTSTRQNLVSTKGRLSDFFELAQ